MRSTSGVCVAFYKFHGGPASPTKRSAVVLTSRHSLILSAPVVSSFFGYIASADPSIDHSRTLMASLAPLPRNWNRPSGRPRHTSGRWSLSLHRSTLVWQPPIDEPRNVKHGVLSWERLRSTPDKPHDDDDNITDCGNYYLTALPREPPAAHCLRLSDLIGHRRNPQGCAC